MADQNLDWTFDHIPAESQAQATEPDAPRPLLPVPRRRRPFPRWLAALLLLLTFLMAGGAGLLVRRGWQEVETQVTAAILYEDEQARAAAVGQVAAAQDQTDKLWLSVREAEAALGWPAAPPAFHLLPADEPPLVSDVTALENDTVQARVTRTFVDSGGRRYAFDLVQRYHSPAAGVWQRLSPDTAALQATETWLGNRLRVTYPSADEAWMQQALPQVDAMLDEACGTWYCSGDRVWLEFSGNLSELVSPSPSARRGNSPFGEYPLAFDLRPRQRRYPVRVVLPSPQLAGQPHDAPASAALLRAIKVEALAALATRLGHRERGSRDFVLDALVARAEVRLGISGPPAYTLSAEDYLPIDLIFWANQSGGDMTLESGLPFRLQALAFLNTALEDQPIQDEGPLLDALLRMQDFASMDEWLEGTIDAEAARTRWAAVTGAVDQAEAPLAWSNMDGLLMGCDWGTALVRNGERVLLPSGTRWFDFGQPAVSPDGRYIAAPSFDQFGTEQQGRMALRIFEPDGRQLTTALYGNQLGLVGWTADNQLLYWRRWPEGANREAGSEIQLWQYDPATGSSDGYLLLADLATAWNADHTALYAAIKAQPDAATELIRMATGNHRVIEPVVPKAHSPALMGDSLAFVTYVATELYDSRQGLSFEAFERRQDLSIELLDLSSQERRVLTSVTDLSLDTEQGTLTPIRLANTQWSPDGQRLAFQAIYASNDRAIYSVARDGSGLRLEWQVRDEAAYFASLTYSADSQYLATHAVAPLADNPSVTGINLVVLEVETHTATQRFGSYPGSTAWSPTGHWLAWATPQGVSVVDPVTLQGRWVDLGQCSSVAWYPP